MKTTMFLRSPIPLASALLLLPLPLLVGCDKSDWTLEGDVFDTGSGAKVPVANAGVGLRCDRHGSDPRDQTVRTNDSGHFTISGKGPVPDNCQVWVDESGFIKSEVVVPPKTKRLDPIFLTPKKR